jgi:hypothetical protein
MDTRNAESTCNHQKQINTVYTNCRKEDVKLPLTVKEIAQAQKDDAVLNNLQKHGKCCFYSIGRGNSIIMQGLKDGHPHSSSETSS